MSQTKLSKSKSGDIAISDRIQILFVVSLALTMTISLINLGYIFDSDNIVFPIDQKVKYILMGVLPLAFFAAALFAVWRKYKTFLSRFFVAGLLATIGYIITQALHGTLSSSGFLQKFSKNVLSGAGDKIIGPNTTDYVILLGSLGLFTLVLFMVYRMERRAARK